MGIFKRNNKETRFDIVKLTTFAISKIKEFTEEHQEETFYGFSIDENLLCLNSLEKFDITLKQYQENWDGYDNPKKIKNLKKNTGDWDYQGFAEFSEDCGFNNEAYEDHYEMDDFDQKFSEYAKAMNQVLKNLKKSDAFKGLKVTKDFFINRVEHNY